MATTYPLASLAAQVTPAGISAPSYTDVLQSLVARARAIYGSDAYLEPDSQDGQLLAIFAAAVNDCNAAAVAAFAQMSPLTSSGEGLSSIVKINGLRRAVSTNSQVSLVISGTVGTVITNGQARDTAGGIWLLPSPTTIPVGGSITVTATAQQVGDVRAGAGTVTTINTPTAGWNSVTNPAAATPGAPVESDAALRIRQGLSTALPARALTSAIRGAVAAVTGVTHSRVYENPTGSTDANGIPARNIAVVVAGGAAADVALAIMNTRSPGAGMFGSTSVALVDDVGQSQTIKFSVPTTVDITCEVNLTGLNGYTSAVGDKIKEALVAYVTGLAPGETVYWGRLFKPALLIGDPDAGTFEINTLKIRKGADPLAQTDVAIGPFELARLLAANTSLVVV